MTYFLFTDPCLLPENVGTTLPHFDSCKMYWRCEGNLPVPYCCPGLERYNPQSGLCEYNPGAICSPENCDSPAVPGNTYIDVVVQDYLIAV